eukprot:gene2851-3542_t
MNDPKLEKIEPVVSSEGNNKDQIFTFESKHVQSYTFVDGKLMESNSQEIKTFKDTPPLSASNLNSSNNNNSLQQQQQQLPQQQSSPLETQKKSNQFTKPLPPIPTQQKQSPSSGLHQQQKQPLTPHNTPTMDDVEVSNINKDSMKKEGSGDPQLQSQDNPPPLKTLNKNPNVGPEQYFTSFQKYVGPGSGENDNIPQPPSK